MPVQTQLISTIFLLAFFPLALCAQDELTRRVGGTVMDSETDEPIPGASVELFYYDSTGTSITTEIGAVTNARGEFSFTSPYTTDLAIQIRSIGYDPMLLRFSDEENVIEVYLFPEEILTPVTEVTVMRRSRSVEDGCCRVESIREEVQQHAPFSPSPVQSLQRYSSCTSGRTINTIDNAGTISLRGLEPTRVGLLLDGVPLFSGPGTFYGLSMLPSHALQTIQIAEGASNARYGNGAISGIVDLQTRVPTEERELTGSFNVLGEIASPDQYDVNLGYTGLAGDVGLALFGSFNDHKLSVPDGNGQLNRGYRRFSGMAKANGLVDNRTEVILTILGGREDRSGELAHNETGLYERELDITQIATIGSVSRLVGESGELLLKGALSRFNIQGAGEADGLDAGQTILYSEGIWSDFAGDHAYEVGLQGRSDRFSGEASEDIGYENTILSLFAQDRFSLSEKWSLLGSMRADRHSDAGLLLSPRGSVRYAFSDQFSMRLMAGQGFKGEATFDEDYRALLGTLHWRPNSEVDFEKSFTLNYDISWDWTAGSSLAGNGNLNFYYTGITDKLLPNPDSLASGTLFYENSTQPARLLGMEWQNRASLEGGWRASVAVALIDYRLQNPDGSYERIPFSPQINLDGALTWYREDLGFTVEAWGSLIGPQRLPYEIDGRTTSPTYGLLNGRIEKEFASGLFAIFTGVLNALDARQNETTPLVQTEGLTPDGSIGWGHAEGREFFLGIRTLVR